MTRRVPWELEEAGLGQRDAERLADRVSSASSFQAMHEEEMQRAYEEGW